MSNGQKRIIVAGSGRSGTTWLGNIIAGDDLKIIFEPLDERRVPELAGLGLRPYFRSDAAYPQWHGVIGKLLCGEIGNEWTDQDANRLDRLKESKGVLIKEIRGNGMLAWLSKNFACQVVYMLRHPCAVITSRMKLGWDSHLGLILNQPHLMEDYLAPYAEIMRRAETDAQKHAVMWCAENLLPLRQLPQYDWIFCSYESLAIESEREAARVLAQLGLEFTEGRRNAIREHSRTCSKRMSGTAINFLGEWQDLLSDADRRDIAAVLGAFGIDFYDVENPMPLRQPSLITPLKG